MKPIQIFSAMVVLASLSFAQVTPAQESEGTTEDGEAVLVRTVRLSQPVEGARQLMIYGVLGGEGHLTLDPNICQLNAFGDDELCTLIAQTHRQVNIARLRIPDPLQMGRTLYLVENAGLRGRLYLVVPPDADDTYRFVYEEGTSRRAITGERLVWEESQSPDLPHAEGIGGVPIIELVGNPAETCHHIDFEEVQIIGGFANNTYFVFVKGTKPNVNMKVKLRPRLYVRRPEYWGIDLVGCVEGDVLLPATAPYVTHISLEGVRGTKGIAIIGKSKVVRLDVPPNPQSKENRGDNDSQPAE